jgi:hypothetical protein
MISVTVCNREGFSRAGRAVLNDYLPATSHIGIRVANEGRGAMRLLGYA